VYPEPLGRPLLAHAVVAEVELAVGQLFNLKESRQTVSQTAHFLLLLCPASLQSVRYVQREVLERLVRLRVRTTVHTVDLREETRSIIRPRFSQEENEEERDFGKRHQSLESAEIPSCQRGCEDVRFARNRDSLSGDRVVQLTTLRRVPPNTAVTILCLPRNPKGSCPSLGSSCNSSVCSRSSM